LWVGTFGGLNKFNRKKESFELIKVPKGQPGLKAIISSYEDAFGNLYFGTSGGGIIFLNKKTNKVKVFRCNLFKEMSKEANIVRDFYEQDNELFVVTVAGIQKVDSTGRFEKVAEHFGDGVPVLRLVFEDKNKTLWAGTEMGLGKLVLRMTTSTSNFLFLN
jgi:ligand-binding sensor domain-containing protein